MPAIKPSLYPGSDQQLHMMEVQFIKIGAVQLYHVPDETTARQLAEKIAALGHVVDAVEPSKLFPFETEEPKPW